MTGAVDRQHLDLDTPGPAPGFRQGYLLAHGAGGFFSHVDGRPQFQQQPA